MICLARRRVIASKFDCFVIHEMHVQSACKRHQQYVTSEIYVKMLGNVYSCLAYIIFVFELISVEIDFVK